MSVVGGGVVKVWPCPQISLVLQSLFLYCNVELNTREIMVRDVGMTHRSSILALFTLNCR